jgi:hypothetical protein
MIASADSMSYNEPMSLFRTAAPSPHEQTAVPPSYTAHMMDTMRGDIGDKLASLESTRAWFIGSCAVVGASGLASQIGPEGGNLRMLVGWVAGAVASAAGAATLINRREVNEAVDGYLAAQAQAYRAAVAAPQE